MGAILWQTNFSYSSCYLEMNIIKITIDWTARYGQLYC